MRFSVIAPNPFHGRLEELIMSYGVGAKMIRLFDNHKLSYPYTWGEIDGQEVTCYADAYHLEPGVSI